MTEEQLEQTFDRLGYDFDQIRLPGMATPAMRLRDLYLRLAHDDTVLRRAEELLARRPTALDLDAAAYLAHLVAIGRAQPKWCQSLSAGASISTDSVPSRDWCYFTVAVNTQDVRVCERMTPAREEAKVRAAKRAGVQPKVAEQLGLQYQCMLMGERVGPRPHYGPRKCPPMSSSCDA